MIETFFGQGALSTANAHLAALVIGGFFGFSLEQAGFGSSKRLAGIFYFRDMAVLKVMFSALVTAMIGLGYLLALGWVRPDQLYFMPTVYGAQIVGGLLFGLGFVMSGWCPGTAAVGLASGKMDALVFLGGALLGSILFNELFPVVKSLYAWGESGVVFVYDAVGLSRAAFAFSLTLVAVGCFWGSEYIERRKSGSGVYWNSPFLRTFSAALLVASLGLFIVPSASTLGTAASLPAGRDDASSTQQATTANRERMLLAAVDAAGDHVEPEELADRMLAEEPGLLVVDVRSAEEYARFHLRGAVHVPLPELASRLAPSKNVGTIVLYSNGMTHPAQARDSLARLGFRNVYILTDGLGGFAERCLKPASLRMGALNPEQTAKITAWRAYFLKPAAGSPSLARADAPSPAPPPESGLPGLVATEWLAGQLGKPGIKILDVRTQPEYNTRHIPGSLFVSLESFRGIVKGIPSMLLPSRMLALHLTQMGIAPSDLVVIVTADKPHDASLAAMVFERLGHDRYAILDGGFTQWTAENRTVDAVLPEVQEAGYTPQASSDAFTVDASVVLEAVQKGGTIILDVRPEDFHLGRKSDEARAGHIPGAVNRPFSEDVVKRDSIVRFKPVQELEAAYAKLIPSKDARVIVHCRTGHQASQTFFVLKRILGYRNVLWYDAGWTEWAARQELPIETTDTKAK
ncbi:MAG: rhodanese-like domain-containing protein [Syntrophobacteraceae bacterium]